MKFFTWLLGKGWNTPTDDVPEEFIVNTRKFKQVPKWTHAGKAGKEIHCPECGLPVRVFNFSWYSLTCSNCKATVKKYQWLLPIKGRK